jgi:hypothetical protein
MQQRKPSMPRASMPRASKIRRPLARGDPAGDRQHDNDQRQRDAEGGEGEPVHLPASTRARAQESVKIGLPPTKGQGGGWFS